MEVRVAFLPDYPLVLSLLKYRGVGVFLNLKMRDPNRGSPLKKKKKLTITTSKALEKTQSLLE